MGNKIHFLWSWIRNHKYACVIIAFLLIIGVLDENSLLSRYHNIRTIRELKSEIRNYTEQYEYDTERLNEITGQTGAVRRIAREQYLMKNEDEDLFVIIDKPDEETD